MSQFSKYLGIIMVYTLGVIAGSLPEVAWYWGIPLAICIIAIVRLFDLADYKYVKHIMQRFELALEIAREKVDFITEHQNAKEYYKKLYHHVLDELEDNVKIST
jgi:hypothetical protein